MIEPLHPIPPALLKKINSSTDDETKVRLRERWRQDELKQIRAAEQRSRFNGVPRQTLRDLRDNPPPAVEWTIDRLAARGSITFSLGTFKSGKSSLIVNLLWSLADGVPFLMTYPVRRIEGNIGYFDFEMGVTETFDRLDKIGCTNDRKIYVYDMVAEGFDLTDDSSFEWIKAEITEVGMEVIVLDALRHIAKKKDGNNDSEIQAIFDQLERLKKECPSLQDIFIPAHTAKADARPGDDITTLGSAAWDGGAQYRWGSYRTRDQGRWKFWFNLLPSRRTDPDAAVPHELNMDTNGVLSIGIAGSLAASSAREQKTKDRKKEIVAFVAANQPTSKNKICIHVGGNRNTVLALIDGLHPSELWIDNDQQVWTEQGYLDHLAALHT